MTKNAEHFEQAFINQRNAELDASLRSEPWSRIDWWTIIMVVATLVALAILASRGLV